MYFGNYGLRKKWLEKSVKNPVSENLSTNNMLDGPKHCRNHDGSTFTIFFDHCEGTWVWKGLF